MDNIKIGVIGGSGIYNLKDIKIVKELSIETPFGMPSDKYIIGNLNGIDIAFLARHGRGHTILPSELNNRANIYGFKKLGVKYLVGISAVGSLREEIKPAHIVFPSQIIDRTKGRVSTFFGDGIVAHIPFAEPFCNNLNKLFAEAGKALSITFHTDKTYVCMEGPAFSTKAESNFNRMAGGDLIGMTAIPEAKLAREAEICYGLIALSTDYDCWREGEESVTVEMVMETLKKNGDSANQILNYVIPKICYEDCSCNHSLDTSIMTNKALWSKETIKKIEPIIKRFL